MNKLLEARIKSMIAELPDVLTYEHDEIVYQGYEADVEPDVRSNFTPAIRLVFVKNEAGDAWVLKDEHNLKEDPLADPKVEI